MTTSNPTASGMYNFTGGPAGQNQQAQPGLSQYLAQGQSGISPGQVQTAAANPINFAAAKGFGNAIAGAASNGMPQPQPAQLNITPGSMGPSQGTSAPMGNLPVAPGLYQSQAALENAAPGEQMYPSPYAAQQAQPYLSRLADAIMGSGSSDAGD